MAPWQHSPRKGPSDASTISRTISLRTLIMLPLGIVIFGVVLYTLQASGKFSAVAYGQLRDTLPSYVSLSRSILSTKQKEVGEKDFREMWNAMEASQLEVSTNFGGALFLQIPWCGCILGRLTLFRSAPPVDFLSAKTLGNGWICGFSRKQHNLRSWVDVAGCTHVACFQRKRFRC
jgi:hypothetical protein